MKKAYTFVLNFGYVESSRLSYLPWTSQQKYANARDALVDLATFLKEKFLEKHAVKVKKCCTDSKAKDPSAEFCRKCGRSLVVDEDFDTEGYMEFVSGINDCDIDTFHGDYIDWNESDRWQTSGLEGASNQRFVYQAEHMLAAAIGHNQHKDRTFDALCKERTKQKTDSFSYW
jgi:hypothetical protein